MKKLEAFNAIILKVQVFFDRPVIACNAGQNYTDGYRLKHHGDIDLVFSSSLLSPRDKIKRLSVYRHDARYVGLMVRSSTYRPGQNGLSAGEDPQGFPPAGTSHRLQGCPLENRYARSHNDPFCSCRWAITYWLCPAPAPGLQPAGDRPARAPIAILQNRFAGSGPGRIGGCGRSLSIGRPLSAARR